MKQIIVFVTLIGLAALWAGEKGHEGHGSHSMDDKKSQEKEASGEMTLKGEVMDLTCYISHPKDGQGKGHAKCAQSCIKKGLPVGLKTTDGTLYLASGKDHSSANEMLAPFGGQTVTLTGTVKEENGMKMILVSSVSKK